MNFILITVVIIGILAFIASISKTSQPNQTNIKSKNKSDTSVFYVKNEVFSFELKGVFYNEYRKIGNFIGYAKNTHDPHDKYSVGIFIDNKLAGYTPKANYRLHNTINQSKDKQIMCWGHISHDSYQNQYFGNVNIPIGFSEEEMKNTEIAIKLIPIQNSLFTKEDKSISEYFELLDNDKKINELISNLKIKNSIDYFFNRNMIPQLSKKLEENKDWESLLKLENYKNNIHDLSLKYMNATLKRIETAKLKITQ